MQFLSVNEGNSVRDDMTVQMILVLMYSDQGLVRREKPICKCLPNLKALHWSDLFILMEGNHVMCIHPSGVFAPELLLTNPLLIYIIIVDCLSGVRTGYVNITILSLFITECIFKSIP